MAIIDFVKWDATPDIYAWKFPENNLSTLTQLVVHESQQAVLFSKGELLETFGPGKHTLSTENIPILRKLFGIPFGGENPFTAEVWFVNRAVALDVKWGTPVPLQLKEPEFKIIVPVRAFGQFGTQIVDAEAFLRELVGTLPSFERKMMQKYLKGILLKHASDIIGKKIALEKISVLEMSAHLIEISEYMKEALNTEFGRFGVEIVNFNVTSINIPEDDPSVVKLKKVLDKKLEMEQLGYTYQEERSYDVLDKTAEAMGEGGGEGGMMQTAMGLGMGVNVGNVMGGMMANMVTPAAQAGAAQAAPHPAAAEMQQQREEQSVLCGNCGAEISMAAKFCGGCGKATQFGTAVDSSQQVVSCDKCSHPFPMTSKFCPECGDPYNPCAACNADNPDDVTSCRVCNAPLPVPCPECQTKVSGDAKFCPNCGKSMAPVCVKCQAELAASAKFCGECGAPQQ